MSDVRMATTWNALPTTPDAGTLFDVTIPALGWTPKAVSIQALTSADDVLEVESSNITMYHSFGATDGVSQWANGGSIIGGETAPRSSRRSQQDSCVEIIGSGSSPNRVIVLDGVGNGAGSIANGWRFFVSTAASAAPRGAIFTFFGGDDLQVDCGSFLLGAGSQLITTGFQPRAIFFGTQANLPGTNGAANFLSGMGVATATDAEQMLMFSVWNQQNPTSLQQSIESSGIVMAQHNLVSPIYDWTAEITGIGATSFTITPSADANQDMVGYLALGDALNEKLWWSGVIDSPTDAGVDWVVNDPGFQPEGLLLLGSFLSATGNFKSAETWGVMASTFDGTREYTIGQSMRHGVATGEIVHRASARAALLYNPSTQALAMDMSNLQFTSQGWQVAAADIAATDGTARKMIGLAFGVPGATEGPFTTPGAADAIIDGLVDISSAGNDAEFQKVRDEMLIDSDLHVVRNSDTRYTVTLPATSGYDIATDGELEVIVPPEAQA